MKMGELIVGCITMLVGIFLAPTVAREVTVATGNFSGASAALWPLVTMMFVIVVVGIGIGLIYRAIKG